MAILYWKKLRIVLLALIWGGSVAVLGKILFYPTSSKSTVTPFSFPQNIPLTKWQPLPNEPIQENKEPHIIAATLYQYHKNNLHLDIEMRYFIKTNGDIQKMAEKHFDAETSPGKLTIHHQEGIGFYGLAATAERAYLSSCINPYGGSTVTAEQFRNNRNTYDLQIARLVPWLLGQQELRDFRCLWTILSVSLEDTTAEQAYPVLENAWVSWYAWWQPRFPKP
ncbi:cyanoexosortase A system-associated protein [Laspinema olomoucense]|uniref:cyanoexosortase A system-associated protein n=1 Tax=Laspinema olomoucense TaxID=3231600 RepID=UPI0021BAACF4|nr:cyanoexosortase A system-associated protein [Laspinema sp. D3a]MCT7986776.1 cyanoexosortase A system-associated protein [Laspinema sp. D3a]